MKFSLPDSSTDLLVKDGKLLMRSLSIYEVLRRFNHIIRLTPFRFEDFLAILITTGNQSKLLNEIHISLLRIIIRGHKLQQTWFCKEDIRVTGNVYINIIENWSEALRLYLSALYKSNHEIVDKLHEKELENYPSNATIEIKLSILEQLCDQFLSLELTRETISSSTHDDKDGNPPIYIGKHDKVCRICLKLTGDLIQCSRCPTVYHLKCSVAPLENNPNLQNTGDNNGVITTTISSYSCALCRSNHIIGVTDCISEEEKNGNLKRNEALGMDKQNRRYYFLARRLFVVDENEEDIKYFSEIDKFDKIIDDLNEDRYDTELIEQLNKEEHEIKRQMQITENLYKTIMKDYLKISNDNLLSKDLLIRIDGPYKNYVNHYSMNTHSRKLKLEEERRRKLEKEKRRREEFEERRRIEEERRIKFEEERRKRAQEEAKKVRVSMPQIRPTNIAPIIRMPITSAPRGPTININPPRPPPGTPVLRYFRTEQGQVIRLPTIHLQPGSPLILRCVGVVNNQTNTYIIRPQITQVTTTTINTSSNPTTIPTSSINSTNTATTTTPSTTNSNGNSNNNSNTNTNNNNNNINNNNNLNKNNNNNNSDNNSNRDNSNKNDSYNNLNITMSDVPIIATSAIPEETPALV